jgi:GntP family gluconate:H+ symporter
MSVPPLAVLAAGVALSATLILRWRVNAFLALIAAAFGVGLLSPHIPLGEIAPEIAGSFGRTCGGIGILIACASVIGQCLLESGAADRIARAALRMFGKQRSSLALLSTGYVLSIPVFFDSVFYLLLPVARSLGVRTGNRPGNGYLLHVLAIAIGAAATHILVPPTPGPLIMAEMLSIDIGTMIFAGIVVSMPLVILTWMIAVVIDRRLHLPVREVEALGTVEPEAMAAIEPARLPSLGASLVPLLLPVTLIAINTVAGAVNKASGVAKLAAFIGNPNVALLLSAAASIHLLTRFKAEGAGKSVEKALLAGGLIVFITAAGGAFGAMLVRAGVGREVERLASDWGLSSLAAAFLLAALLKISQGSATVALITVASLMAPMIAARPGEVHAAWVACAIGCGAMTGSWMNDSGFWVFQQMTGFTVSEALKSWTLFSLAFGLIGFAMTLYWAAVLPLR